jgi:hypothetical protein
VGAVLINADIFIREAFRADDVAVKEVVIFFAYFFVLYIFN